jgi:hypothetical protein
MPPLFRVSFISYRKLDAYGKPILAPGFPAHLCYGIDRLRIIKDNLWYPDYFNYCKAAGNGRKTTKERVRTEEEDRFRGSSGSD